jgi:class 3 adenylate cyclase
VIDYIEEVKKEIIRAQKSGDYLKEYDLAQAALKEKPDEEFFQYHSVMALARCDAKKRALDSFYTYKLYLSKSENVLALESRILKDLAFSSLDHDSLRIAAHSYLNSFNQTGGYYSAINAATLFLLSGDLSQSQHLAEISLAQAIQDHEKPYFSLVTQAEAYLLLNRVDEARKALEAAGKLRGDNLLVGARNKRQLQLICAHNGYDNALLDPLLPETVIYYCGHIFDQHRPATLQQQQELQGKVASVLSNNYCAIAYGSLAAGSDIMFAEAILQRGGELNIWLPFTTEEFCNVSVRPAGEHWVKRFHDCLKRASSISYATESEFLGDDSLFEYCADVAMGMAVMRANSLSAKALQVAIWDQRESDPSSSTYQNILKWSALQHDAEFIACPGLLESRGVRSFSRDFPEYRRQPRAILFSDVRGYSKLHDRDVLWYFNVLHPQLAKAIEKFRPEIQLIDTWGDAIYLVTEKATTLARIAFELDQVLKQIDQSALQLDEPLLMRIGLHYGPVFSFYDHLEQKQTYSSTEVSKTARIEPVTPPGEMFGTEAFVSKLELEGEDWATFEYAGVLPSAKNYGSFRMFHIRPKHQPPTLLCSLNYLNELK